MQSQMENGVIMQPVGRLPPGRKAIDTRMVYKVKLTPDGKISRYKSRLVAQGFRQRPGIDYTELYAPVCQFHHHSPGSAGAGSVAAFSYSPAGRQDCFPAAGRSGGWEEIYVSVPCEIQGGGGLYRLRRAIYGLKQSPRHGI